ncbi:Phage capsid family [Popillia japonica]|uniref:Phage capsid family n=1 Tax=Popillia japonica TaxID=7064 RepID=A0AAW1HVG9_POPJA
MKRRYIEDLDLREVSIIDDRKQPCYMATSIEKKLQEERAEKVEAMEKLLEGAKTEERAVNEEESKQIDELGKQIEAIDKTIESDEKLRAFQTSVKDPEERGTETETTEETEVRAFADFVRGSITEERAGEMTFGDNGAVIPRTIAAKIIQKVYDMCPILEKSTRYNVKGTLDIPFYPADSNDITMAYSEEFTELTSTSGKFGSIQLTGYLAGVLTKVSRSLINNADVDIVNHVVNQMAYNVSRFIERELLIGTTGKSLGLSGIEQSVSVAAVDAITADELIDLQEVIKDAFQRDSIWIMAPSTRTAIRKLKKSHS